MGVYLYSKLPSEYQEVEYVQSSGTQYIILGNSFKTSYKAVIDFQMTVIGGDYIPLGIKYRTTRYGIDAYNSKFMVNGGGEIWNNTISEDTNRHTITIDKGTARVDGNNYSVPYTNYTFSQGIGVFCYNEYDKSPQYNYKSSNKLYKLDIYDENGKHIYDIVPCYRKSDGVIGLYDLVNSVFYTNSGTGTFSKGADVTAIPLKNAYIGEVGEYTISNIPTTDTNIYVNVARSGKTIQSVTFKFIVNWASGKGVYIQMSANNSNTMRYGPVLETGAGTGLRIRGRTSGSDTYFRTITTGYNSGGVNNVEFTINRDGTGKVICNGGITNYTATGSELTIIQTIMNLSNMNVYAAQNANMLSGSKVDTTVIYS